MHDISASDRSLWRYRPLVPLAVLACLAACGREQSPAPPPGVTAATLGPQETASVADYLAEARYRNASRELGDRLLLQCTACHSLDAGGAHLLGPNLHGIFNRKPASVANFAYTRALREADFVWTPRAMDAWLARPAHFLPGNAMAYPGLRQQEDRDALIASLLRKTAAGAN